MVYDAQSRTSAPTPPSRFSISAGQFREKAIGNTFWESGSLNKRLYRIVGIGDRRDLPNWEGLSGEVGRTIAGLSGYDGMTVSTDPYALIVDDDPIILMDLDGILSDAGFRCIEADHGDAAMAMLPDHAESITLLFSEVEMPGGTNGFALARHVASTYPWIEIVIASGRIKPEPGEMPDQATFIGKPFSATMVHNHLREKLPDGKKPEPLKSAV